MVLDWTKEGTIPNRLCPLSSDPDSPTWVCPLTTTSSAKRTLTGLFLRRALFSADIIDDLGFYSTDRQQNHAVCQRNVNTRPAAALTRGSTLTYCITVWKQLILAGDVSIQSRGWKHIWRWFLTKESVIAPGECVFLSVSCFVLTVMCRRIVTLIQSSKSLCGE